MLNRFYEDNVKMTREETKRNVDIVMALVDNILTYVHERDERFKIRPLHVSSYYSHLKVTRADEFDYSVVLDIPSIVWGSGSTPAYYGYDENKQVVSKSVPLPPPPVGKYFTQVGGLIEKWNQQRLNEGQSCLTVDEHIISIKFKGDLSNWSVKLSIDHKFDCLSMPKGCRNRLLKLFRFHIQALREVV